MSMSGQPSPWEQDDGPRRDVFAAELVGDPGPDGRNPVAGEVGGWVSRAIEWVRARWRSRDGRPPAEEPSRGSVVAGRATATAVGALEGTLASKSLDGALKEAQILDAYASARQKNAEALKLEAEARKLDAEAEKLRQDAAFERVKHVIDIIERQGAPVAVTRLPDGRVVITAGDGLSAELPEAVAEGESPLE